MEDLNYAVAITSLLMVVWQFAPLAVAVAKGYNGRYWFFAFGLVGVVVLAMLPRLEKQGGLERKELVQRANRLGLIFSVLGALMTIGVAMAIGVIKY